MAQITMNSVYGFVGAKVSPLPCLPVAMCTTAVGRKMIEDTRDYVEAKYAGTQVVYGDTDSVFVRVAPYMRSVGKDPNDMAQVFEVSEAIANDCTTCLYRYPNVLEYEKTYCPFILLAKKRYLGVKFDAEVGPDAKGKVSASGVQLVRRDVTPFVRETLRVMVDKLLAGNVLGARRAVIQRAEALLKGEIPVADITMSKSLRAKYKPGVIMPHVTVRDRLAARDPGSEPRPPDRVPFVYMTQTSSDGAYPDRQAGLRAEDPAWVVEKGLEMQVDFAYYITNTLEKPVIDIMASVDPGCKAVFEDLRERVRRGGEFAAQRMGANAAKRQREISSFFAPRG